MLKGPSEITGSNPGLCVLKIRAQPGQKVSAGRKMPPSTCEQSPFPRALALEPGTTAVTLRGECVEMTPAMG